MLLPGQAHETPLVVTVSILPLKSMIETIGGDRVAVSVMVPPGTDPKLFEPSPVKMAALEASALYVAVGLAAEKNWMPQLCAARPDMPVLKMNEHVKTRMIAGKGENTGKEIPDPHIWIGQSSCVTWPRRCAMR